MHLAAYPCTVAVYSHASGHKSICKWLSSHVQHLVMQYGPQNKISLGHSTEGLDTAQNHMNSILKIAPQPWKELLGKKIVNLETALLRPLPSMLESFQVKENIYSALWTTTQNDIWIRISRQIRSQIWNSFRMKISGLGRLGSRENPRLKISWLCL